MYNKKTLMFLVVIFLNIFFILPLMGHSTEYKLITKGSGVEVVYGDGTPMPFADVRVYAPGKKKIYQKGMTDRKGRFMFSPDSQGQWKIFVSDGMGHGIKTKILVGKNGLVNKREIINHVPQFYKLVTGLSLILGMTGFFMYFSIKRKNKEKG